MIEVSRDTDPDLLVQEAEKLAMASDFVGLLNLIQRAYAKGIDPLVIEMMSRYVETSLF